MHILVPGWCQFNFNLYCTFCSVYHVLSPFYSLNEANSHFSLLLVSLQALDLKPNYVRAWANMGISYANQVCSFCQLCNECLCVLGENRCNYFLICFGTLLILLRDDKRV